MKDFAKYIGVRVDELEKALYKAYGCGPWIKWNRVGISIGSIVEGSDAEFKETFFFPFKSEDYENWMNELEVLCEDAWNEANTGI